ncbi:MAG: SDR family oxidoreductase [Actinomycetota bacterium]|nr:SDR family oxidoreductase [Actinomycetota bacterium]
MDLGIDDRVALVMGASQGIGRGIAAALAREGARVAIASRSAEKLERVAGEIGAEATFAVDTADLDSLAGLPQSIRATLGGPVEVLVTNTGGPPAGGVQEHDAETWESAYRHLVLAPRALIQAVLPGMKENRWGRIVNVGSTSTIEVIPHLGLSNTHRMAAVGYLKTLAREVAGDGITVNTVATGKIATDRLAGPSGSLEEAETMARDQVPARRLGTPAEYGDLVAFLCSNRAAYITGVTVPIDGGLLRST